MRLSSTISALWCAAAASAARVLVFDSDVLSSASPTSDTVDPATARLILAQRLGLDQSHALPTAASDAIRQINAYGAAQSPLFGHERRAKPTAKLMMVIEGEDDEADYHKHARSFQVSSALHPDDLLELVSEDADTLASEEPDYQILDALAPLTKLSGSTLKSYDSHRTIFHTKVRPEQKHVLSKTIAAVLRQVDSRKMSLTLVFTPLQSGSKRAKRTANAARGQPEKPLFKQEPSALPNSQPAPFTPVTATKILSGPIPTCFSTRDACERGTNNCTSHGECILRWSTDSTNDDGSSSKRECFGCACTKPEVRKNKDGTKKTTKFGGGACHKKDIVFPFWLLTGVTVFIIFIATWGVGLLYEMGNQELPSVIGAGVSGPKASR